MPASAFGAAFGSAFGLAFGDVPGLDEPDETPATPRRTAIDGSLGSNATAVDAPWLPRVQQRAHALARQKRRRRTEAVLLLGG